MALGGAAWRNETRAWRRAMLKTPRPNTAMAVLSSPDMIAELPCPWPCHETRSVSRPSAVRLSKSMTVTLSESEVLNPRNRLPESCGTGLYLL